MKNPTLLFSTVLIVLLCGCSGFGPGTPAGSPTDSATGSPSEELTPKPLPEKPPELTNESVADYVERCERVTLWNDLKDTGISDLEFDELTVIVTRNGTTYTSTAYVDGWRMYEEPEPEGIGFRYTARYVVNESATTRRIVSGTRPWEQEVQCE